MPIISTAGEFIESVHLIDLNQYGMSKITSSFLLHWDNSTIIFDVGTSDDYRKVLSYMRKHHISRDSVKYLIPSHHHFDHFGAGWKILTKLEKYNPKIKILATELHKTYLQHPENHLKAARSTYGEFVGRMEPIPDRFFQLIEPDTKILLDEERELELSLISTPGHTKDHVCPTIFMEGSTYFSYFGEAAGTLFNKEELLTLPTSMPTEFNYEEYMQSLKKIQGLEIENAGFCHYGAVTSLKDVKLIVEDQIKFVPIFREFVKNNYEKFKATRSVVEATIQELFLERSSFHRTEDLKEVYKGISTRNALALVYGMLVDLGYKKNKY
ncbi:MAG: MBL fold metallo-hydrolase [Candidatus Lokiarchaeota archaeon]|nr:MBL fold metallo-hydrolase [Candidatus Lokiarchaeota archaeon]